MGDYRAPREWKRRLDSHSGEQLARLQSETGLSAVTLRVCMMRGLETSEAILDFLSPKLETLTNPMAIKDMDRAVERLARARDQNERIRVFGDYDVDGTTGAALLTWVFREIPFQQFDARQPDRFKDGYGLNVAAVDEAAASGVQVLVTVDCGISSFDAAERAAALGIDLIILDHHQISPERGLPKAHAVVNPQRADCESGLKQLCGCGVAFYLAMALRGHGREKGWFQGRQEPNLKQHLDLLVIATAADMVPLGGDNRALVRHGMQVLKQSRKPGVRALLEVAGLASKEVSPGHLGFVLGPRINASGRMHSASLAFELLTTSDTVRAYELANDLERLNRERAELQNQIWDEVRAQAEKGIAEGRYKHGIVVADPGWHEGVVGIVASRVTETFRRPAAVIALREDFGKGSVRSYGGKDVLSALRVAGEHLLGFGGHKYAAGLTVALDQVEAFTAAFDHALGEVEVDPSSQPLFIEGACEMSELDVKTLQELELLGPFGPGNPEPVFSIRAGIRGHQVLKGRHMKFNLSKDQAVLDAIWFNAAEREEVVRRFEGSSEIEIEWAGVPELNRFRGRVTPTFRIRDWREPS